MYKRFILTDGIACMQRLTYISQSFDIRTCIYITAHLYDLIIEIAFQILNSLLGFVEKYKDKRGAKQMFPGIYFCI